MLRGSGFIAMAVLAGTLTGCATMRVSSFVQSGVDLSVYRTWNWGQADALPTGDPRLDNNEMFHERVQTAVERALTRKGYELTSAGAPGDLLFHYHVSISQRIAISDLDQRFSPDCPGGGCGPEIHPFEEGTLILDAVDARTGRLVWRGWAQDTVEGVIDDQDRLDRRVDEAVGRIVEGFPIARGRPRTMARLERP